MPTQKTLLLKSVHVKYLQFRLCSNFLDISTHFTSSHREEQEPFFRREFYSVGHFLQRPQFLQLKIKESKVI
jgi:hypothetical protein